MAVDGKSAKVITSLVFVGPLIAKRWTLQQRCSQKDNLSLPSNYCRCSCFAHCNLIAMGKATTTAIIGRQRDQACTSSETGKSLANWKFPMAFYVHEKSSEEEN